MEYKVGDYVVISSRILTMDYSNFTVDEPTDNMKSMVGRTGVVVDSCLDTEYILDFDTGITWIAEELDPGAVNKGEFTNVKEV